MKSCSSSRLPLQHHLANVLFGYCSTPHSTTGHAPSALFLGQKLCTCLYFPKPNCKEHVLYKLSKQAQSITNMPNLDASKLDSRLWPAIMDLVPSGCSQVLSGTVDFLGWDRSLSDMEATPWTAALYPAGLWSYHWQLWRCFGVWSTTTLCCHYIDHSTTFFTPLSTKDPSTTFVLWHPTWFLITMYLPIKPCLLITPVRFCFLSPFLSVLQERNVEY